MSDDKRMFDIMDTGHDRSCGWGAGADCYCSVYTRALAQQRSEGRREWRQLQVDSGLCRDRFRNEVDALDAHVPSDVSEGAEDPEIISNSLNAARIVSAAHWLAGTSNYAATAIEVLNGMVAECHERNGCVMRWTLAEIAMGHVEARQDREAEWASDYESMDGDHESALASCGWGTDEDYGYYGGDE